jgi:hypothetical protein
MSTPNSVTREAGRALDREVALAIFGTDAPHAITPEYDLPYFSTDIECAWRVVEEFTRAGKCVSIDYRTTSARRPETPPYWIQIFPPHACAGAETAPHAICLAALKAAGAAPQGET